MPKQPAITDAQVMALLPGCLRREEEAFEALYDLYADRLYRYLLARLGDSETAADLTNELFVRVVKAIGSFRPDKGHPAGSLSAWLYRIAANLVADHYRRRRPPDLELDPDLPLASAEPTPQRLIEHRETQSQLAAAIEQLTEDQRLVVIAKFVEGMSNSETAAWLDKSEGAVESLQHRALRTLGRLLGGGKAQDER